MNYILSALIDFIFPPICMNCEKIGKQYLCDECRNLFDSEFDPKKHTLNGGNGYIDEVFSLFSYKESHISKLLIEMKHERLTDYYNALLPYIKDGMKKSGYIEKSDFITFCPRSRFNKNKYGFDQSEDIAKIISEEFDIPFENVIKRFPISFTQHRFNAKMRRWNVKNTFSTNERFDGMNVIVFDDIVTTGSTTEAIAKVLKKNGAMKVFVFSIAH